MRRVLVIESIAVVVLVVALVAVVVANAGLVHLVHSRKFHGWLGTHICVKRKWTLSHTFMNLDEYVGQPERVAQLDDDVVLALVRCPALSLRPARLASQPVAPPVFSGPESYAIVTPGSSRPGPLHEVASSASARP